MNGINKGIVYGVGVGPGDPELMTLKAVRLIKQNDIIALPGKEPRKTTAFNIAAAAVPELFEKELLPIHIPMVSDRQAIESAHKAGAALIEKQLDCGKNVVYLTLGDPTVYCSFSYIQHILEADGYEVRLVSGVTSFCAAAARLNVPLAEWDEAVTVLPALHYADALPDVRGTLVLMKSAGRISEIKARLKSSGRSVSAVINCGMENELVCRSAAEIPDDAGYFSLIIAK